MLAATASPHFNYSDLDGVLNQPETEHNWASKETALKTLGGACNSAVAQNSDYIAFIKNHRKAFAESLLTERTRLSGAACELVEKLATSMGRDFGLHFADLFTGPLLKVCARTNKVMVSRAMKALNSMINAGCLATLPKACQAFATNNKALRISCIGLVASCIAQFPSQELEPFLAAFEPILKEGVSDAAPEVRDTSRKSYKVYAEKFPERSQILTATLPGNVLKYLLPDTRSNISQARTTSVARPAPGMSRLAEAGEVARHQSSRELTAGISRTGPSRIGPVRSRTMAMSEHGAPTSFKAQTLSTPQALPSSQSYPYHANQHLQPQVHQQQNLMPQQHPHHHQHQHQHQTLTRNHGPASRTGSFADTPESSGHGALRMSAQRNRTLSSTLSTSSMIQRSPSINLATNGSAQRVVPTAPYGADSPKPTRPSTLSNRLSKTDISKPSRISALSNASVERDQMSASERAKAYSASLKNEMANRRSADLQMRTGMGARRVTTDHASYAGYGSLSSTSVSASSSASTASTSTATSTTSVSPASSSSTSPTTVHSPNHDHLFSTFRATASSQLASSPPESCPSPDMRHSTPPTSQQSDESVTPAPLSPTSMAQVSLEASSTNTDMDGSYPSSDVHSFHPQRSHDASAMLNTRKGSAPLSPHSPLHPQLPSPSHEFAEAGERDFEVLDAYVNEDAESDADHNMSIPDHESLFGNTESYLQIEKEILELQQSLKGRTGARTGDEDRSVFMDEDPHSLEEQQAVKAYADAYEATMAVVAPCPPSSSHEEQ